MGVIISLLVSVVCAAIIVWVADRTARPQTVLDILNQRLARGEIDRTEYDEKRKLIGRDSTLWTVIPTDHALDMVPRLRIVARRVDISDNYRRSLSRSSAFPT